SRLTNLFFNPTLEIGKGGSNNRFTVLNGARADLFTTAGNEFANTVLGSSATATGNFLLVADTNSRFASPTLLIGSNGPGSQLRVTNGGFVADAVAALGALTSSSNNSAIIGGLGSVWSNSVLLIVGSNGPANSLIVSNGATIFANA